MSTYPKVARQAPRAVAELGTAAWRWTQWLGGDSSAMCVRQDGTVVMFCGDTYTTEVPSGITFVGSSFTNNSLLWWKDGAFGVEYSSTQPGVNIFGSPFPYFASTLSPAGFRWAQGAWVDEATDGLVHVMVTDYEGTIFTSYAAVDLREYIVGDDMQIVSQAVVPGLAPQTVGGEVVAWGHAVVTDRRANYTYIFGAWRVTGDGYRLVVCRRAAGSGSLPGNLPSFWDGSAWSASMGDIVSLGPTTGNSLSVVAHPGGGWLCTSCRKGLLTNDVAAWHSDTPNGTWTDLGDIFEVPAEFAGQFNYGGLSFVTPEGKLRVMYNLNGPIAEIREDYRRYGVRWAEVDVPARP